MCVFLLLHISLQGELNIKILKSKNVPLDNWMNRPESVEHGLAYQTIKKVGEVLTAFNISVESAISEYDDQAQRLSNTLGSERAVNGNSDMKKPPGQPPSPINRGDAVAAAAPPDFNVNAAHLVESFHRPAPNTGAVRKHKVDSMSTIYPKIKAGYTGRCRILNFKDIEQQICYMTDLNR